MRVGSAFNELKKKQETKKRVHSKLRGDPIANTAAFTPPLPAKRYGEAAHSDCGLKLSPSTQRALFFEGGESGSGNKNHNLCWRCHRRGHRPEDCTTEPNDVVSNCTTGEMVLETVREYVHMERGGAGGGAASIRRRPCGEAQELHGNSNRQVHFGDVW